jgi:NADH:ubiquinone oxidoreductase subunit 5 (subunit L)/multisubunit Na+/H+ antiporter MnhA subunit
LLFLATGSVLHATKERSLGKLGGLIHRMPWVAWLALVGTLAIAGLPPLNLARMAAAAGVPVHASLPQSFVNMLVDRRRGVVLVPLAAYVMVKFTASSPRSPARAGSRRARDAGILERIALMARDRLRRAGCRASGPVRLLDHINAMLIGSTVAHAATASWLFLAPSTPIARATAR